MYGINKALSYCKLQDLFMKMVYMKSTQRLSITCAFDLRETEILYRSTTLEILSQLIST